MNFSNHNQKPGPDIVSSEADKFDYIIAGAGCAGLSLAMHMIHSKKFSEKKILIVDHDAKKANDRTWCYWSATKNIFDPIVFRRWQKLWFHSDEFSKQMQVSPYQYKMIRGIDFYNYCFREIAAHSNFKIIQRKVDRIVSKKDSAGIVVDDKIIWAQYVFNSILFEKPLLKKKDYLLLQHFKGWIIETPEQSFDTDSAVLMDFRTAQDNSTAFCYVLPLSPERALIEYTLFSGNILTEEEYENGLRSYISRILKIPSYKVVDTESGVIPMTNHKFASRQQNIINIGLAGGQAKPSTGYSFNFIQKHSAEIVLQLIKNGHPFISKSPGRFLFYDAVLLRILYKKKLGGKHIFTDLFRKNKVLRILRFLDNETGLDEELKIISTLPTLPFLKAAIKHLF